jgi:hypothetical protein
MRTGFIIAAIGLTSVGYFVSPVAAKPVANCWKNLLICEQTGRRNGYSVSLTDTICSASFKKCDQSNESQGRDYMGRPFGGGRGSKGGKKSLATTTNGGKTTQVGTVKTGTPISAVKTGTTTPTAAVKIITPKPPTVSTGTVLGKPRPENRRL